MNVTINLAKYSGFCFGVKRAIDITFHAATTRNDIVILGDLVHNEDVVKKIEVLGIRKICRLEKGKGRVLIIRAHGAAKNTINKARILGYDIIDATCPMVREIHHIVQDMEKKDYSIIVIGDQNHEEVKGIVGQLKHHAIIIDDKKNILSDRVKKITKACVVVQSTQNVDKALSIVSALKKHIEHLKFFNTICIPTRKKQGEIKQLALSNDLMIIIGSRTSANTKRLYEIAKSINKNTYWVQAKEEINPRWLHQVNSVGIGAGSSTPEETIKSVVEHIEDICKAT